MSEFLENPKLMERISIEYYNARCRCKEPDPFKIKRNFEVINRRKPLEYPKDSIYTKTFHIHYEKPLSTLEKTILNTFENKYIYYALDDILDLLRIHPMESQDLLMVLYSVMVSLQNNFFVNFFDIWIQEIYLEEISKRNKFLKENSPMFSSKTYLTLKVLYKHPAPPKERITLW